MPNKKYVKDVKYVIVAYHSGWGYDLNQKGALGKNKENI